MKRVVALLVLIVPLLAIEFPPPPSPDQYVQDLVDIIPSHYEDSINNLCTELEEATSAEMAVLTISSFGGEEPRVYATELGNFWGVGDRDEDNGLVMVVAVDDREVFTATGTGAEKIMPDSVVNMIFADILVPSFQTGDYGSGIYEAMQQYARIILGFYQEHPEGMRKFFMGSDFPKRPKRPWLRRD